MVREAALGVVGAQYMTVASWLVLKTAEGLAFGLEPTRETIVVFIRVLATHRQPAKMALCTLLERRSKQMGN